MQQKKSDKCCYKFFLSTPLYNWIVIRIFSFSKSYWKKKNTTKDSQALLQNTLDNNCPELCALKQTCDTAWHLVRQISHLPKLLSNQRTRLSITVAYGWHWWPTKTVRLFSRAVCICYQQGFKLLKTFGVNRSILRRIPFLHIWCKSSST